MNLKEYYTTIYLPLHSKPITRYFHMIGNILTLLWIGVCIYNSEYFLLLLSPFIIYLFAWPSHYVFEKNEPAAFSNMWYAKASDWIMMYQMITKKLK